MIRVKLEANIDFEIEVSMENFHNAWRKALEADQMLEIRKGVFVNPNSVLLVEDIV